MNPWLSALPLVLAGDSAPPRPPIIPRGPLPPFDTPQPPGYEQVHTTLPDNQIIPVGPMKRWPRANWFSVEVPGLPFVPGQSSEHPEMVLTYFLHKYSHEWQDRILLTHAQRGYTHFMISWPDARRDGLSVADFVALALRVKAVIPFVHVMLASKADPHDQTWPGQIQQILEPVLRALVEANAVDLVSLWETDLWNVPGAPLQSILDAIAAICAPAGVEQWYHGSVGNVWWGVTNRTDWWEHQIGVLVGVLYQGDVNWPVGLRSARMADTTNKPSAAPRFADGTFKLCAAEMDGMLVYSVPFSEDLGDLHTWEELCTPGACPVTGFCNGGRYPSGAVI